MEEVTRQPVLASENPIFIGDAREILRGMPAGSVQCCVTSPPYYGLRDYGVGPVVWGGERDCQHEWGAELPPHHPGQVEQSKWKNAEAAGKGQTAASGQFCSKCGAWRGNLGLEPTPELYCEHLVEIFQGVKRVLRDDGVVWLNLGNSYWGGKGASNYAFQSRRKSKSMEGDHHNIEAAMGGMRPQDGPHEVLKPKDLIGIPWRAAFALQADGWYLRSDVIWAKGVSGQKELAGQVADAMREQGCSHEQIEGAVGRLGLYVGNAMPESVRDRPSRGHENLFLLTKNKRYFYDKGAIAEVGDAKQRAHNIKCAKSYDNQDRIDGGQPGNVNNVGIHSRPGASGRNRRDVWTITTKPCAWEYCLNCDTLYEGKERNRIKKRDKQRVCPACGSTDHWVDHFAQFPPDLIEPCILAGTSEKGCCPECGKPWRRTKQRTNIVDESAKGSSFDQGRTGTRDGGDRTQPGPRFIKVQTGWEPSCDCGEWTRDGNGNQTKARPIPVPCVVLDLFAGAGTTGIVAVRQGREFVGIDLNPAYAAVALARVRRQQGRR